MIIYGVFGPEDKILDVGITLNHAEELRHNFQLLSFNRLKREDTELPFNSLEEMLTSEMGAAILGDIVIGEISFEFEDVNFLTVCKE